LQDLRNFLAVLEQRGDLARIKREVDPIHEVAAVMKRSSELNGPALLFENVRGSKIRLAGNVVAGRHRVAVALGTTTDELLETYRQRLRAPIAPVRVNEPGQTEAISGLSALPIIKLSERDAGRYMTAGVIFAAHPETGKINLSFQRMCPVSDDAVAIFAGETSDLYTYLIASRGKPLPVAVGIGLHPAFFLVAGTRFPAEEEEIALAGGLLGEAVRLNKSIHGQWIVPEAAEIVLQGEIDFQNQVPEGPFGEYTGYYGAGTLQPRLSPILRFQSMKTKKDPVYQTVITGPTLGYESAHLSPLSKEAMLYAKLSKMYPSVQRVSLCMGRYMAAVQVDENFPDEDAKRLMNDVFTASVYIKYAILVDSDVDVMDPRDVLWAMSTRVDPGKHMHIFGNMVMETLDPSTDGRCDKVGFDARKPKGEVEGFVRTRIPGSEKIRIEEYLPR
jgi:2,5-furandicarboxylate decarboxylase 1